MIFIISLIVAVLIAVLLQKPLKKCPVPFYILSAVIAIILSVFDFENAGEFVSRYVFDLFRRGALGTALFVVVMYIGALKNGSKPMKYLYPIRGQLSIIASILCLCHNVFYGRTYFVNMFTDAANMPLNQMIAGILTIILLIIMIPLFITSFRCIRNRMEPKKWKKLQRFAYGYYGILYIHIMLLFMPFAMRGMTKYVVSIIVYSIVYGVYAIIRLQKSKKIAGGTKRCLQAVCGIIAAIIMVVSVMGCSNAIREKKEQEAIEAAEALAEAQRQEELANSKKYADGTYSGTAHGYCNKITVEVDVLDDVITEIRITDCKDDKPYMDKAIKVIDYIMEQQSTAVDTVSGATVSSEGIKGAVKSALKAAAAAQKEAVGG